MVAIGCSAANAQTAQTEDFYKPKMTKPEAVAYLKTRNIALVPDILPQTILSGDVKGLEALIVAGLDLKAKGSLPQSPLDLAAMSCSAGPRVKPEETRIMVDLLLAGGVDPNQGMPVLPALMIAAQQRCAPVVIRHLLAGGAKIDIRNPQGVTPLSMALEVRNYEGAQTLIDAGARISPEAGRKILAGSDDDPRLGEIVARATAGK